MSDKPVAERLQVKGDRRLAVLGASQSLEKLIGAKAARADMAKADVILLFALDRARLQKDLPAVLKKAPVTSILWVAYPKLTSPMAADLNRDEIRSLAPQISAGYSQPDRD